MLEASVIAIGDELLSGYVRDANSPWFAERLRTHGVPLSCIHVVADTMEAIDEAMQAELARSRPRLIVTCGGVGSTPDDLTFEAVAASLGREMVEHPVLAERIGEIVERTRAHGLDVDETFTRHLSRMARIPAGSRLLTPADGWLPGVAVDVAGGVDDGGATVLVLPGVPEAFRRLVTDVVEPQLLAGRNQPPAVEEITHSFPESALNGVFARVLSEFEDVRLGSYPGRPMMVRLTGPDAQVAAAAEMVRTAVADLEASEGGARLAAAWRARGTTATAAANADADFVTDEDDA